MRVESLVPQGSDLQKASGNGGGLGGLGDELGVSLNSILPVYSFGGAHDLYHQCGLWTNRHALGVSGDARHRAFAA